MPVPFDATVYAAIQDGKILCDYEGDLISESVEYLIFAVDMWANDQSQCEGVEIVPIRLTRLPGDSIPWNHQESLERKARSEKDLEAIRASYK